MTELVDRKRVLLLTALLASALIAAAFMSVIYPIAAETANKINVVMRDGAVEVYKDGELVKTFKAPEGAKHFEVFVSPEGDLTFRFNVAAPSPEEASDLEEKAIELVKNDRKVRETIGDEFEIIGVVGKWRTTIDEGEAKAMGAIVLVKAADGSCYSIYIDLDEGVVKSIEKDLGCRLQLVEQ